MLFKKRAVLNINLFAPPLPPLSTVVDGKTNRYEGHLPFAAPALKAAGVQVYSVGIGNIDIAELQLISSDPDDEHVFILSSFRDAAGFVDFLSVTTCESEFIFKYMHV